MGSHPNYCLEALRGDRRGLHSIRIKEQRRISSIRDAIDTDLSGCRLTGRAGGNSRKNLPRDLQFARTHMYLWLA